MLDQAPKSKKELVEEAKELRAQLEGRFAYVDLHLGRASTATIAAFVAKYSILLNSSEEVALDGTDSNAHFNPLKMDNTDTDSDSTEVESIKVPEQITYSPLAEAFSPAPSPLECESLTEEPTTTRANEERVLLGWSVQHPVKPLLSAIAPQSLSEIPANHPSVRRYKLGSARSNRRLLWSAKTIRAYRGSSSQARAP